jgi:TFIIF-interacting CTD phosphatase-like protein
MDSCEGLTTKSLQRLFPCDTSMVVIIDDRADVWEWSPNLIKVIPCKSQKNRNIQETIVNSPY